MFIQTIKEQNNGFHLRSLARRDQMRKMFFYHRVDLFTDRFAVHNIFDRDEILPVTRIETDHINEFLEIA